MKGLKARLARWKEKVPGVVAVISGLIAIAVGVITLAPTVEGWFEGEPPPVEVELGEVSVSNPRMRYAGAGQAPETEPMVTATVRNNGENTAYVDEARITVLDGTHIKTCFTQGGGPEVPHTKPYRVTMPEFPSVRQQVIHEPLHVEIQPGHGARPLLKFQKRLTASTDLYEIDVKYVVDPGEKVLDVGRFVIGVPGPPDRGGYTIPEDQEALTSEEFRGGPSVNPELSELAENLVSSTSWCLLHNLEGVRRLAADPGRRGVEIKALAHVVPAPAWEEIEAERGAPREAVEKFLGEEFPLAIAFAVDAAEATGEPGYEKEVRRRAAAKLIEIGEKDLDDGGTVAIEAIEQAIALEPADAGTDLLAEAKAAAITAEEKRLAEVAAEESTVASGSGE